MKMKFLTLLLLCSSPVWSKSKIFDLSLERPDPENKSLLWGPLASFILPGADQFYEGKTEAGFFYAGIGAFGLTLAATSGFDPSEYSPKENEFDNTEDGKFRKYIYGLQTYQTAGILSAYASFRSAVKYRKHFGQYAFLEKEETVDELMFSPFEFSFLKRKTTFLPLIIVSLLAGSDETVSTGNLSTDDTFFSGGISYNAGVGEEALFRGMMLPNFHEAWGSPIGANIGTSLIFGAAHGVKKLPWPQMVVGYYLGWLTQKNNYSLKEASFIHVWWDVIAICGEYMKGKAITRPVYLPLLTKTF